jgi:hypothetical protein
MNPLKGQSQVSQALRDVLPFFIPTSALKLRPRPIRQSGLSRHL